MRAFAQDLQRKEDIKVMYVEVIGQEPPPETLADHLQKVTDGEVTLEQVRQSARTPGFLCGLGVRG